MQLESMRRGWKQRIAAISQTWDCSPFRRSGISQDTRTPCADWTEPLVVWQPNRGVAEPQHKAWCRNKQQDKQIKCWSYGVVTVSYKTMTRRTRTSGTCRMDPVTHCWREAEMWGVVTSGQFRHRRRKFAFKAHASHVIRKAVLR